MVESQARGFMITNRNNLLYLLFFLGCSIALNGCEDEQLEDQIPYQSFSNIVINLNGQQYLDLNSLGYVPIDGGVKGIMLYKNPFESEYVAYERNCSFEPNSSCARVEVDGSGLFMIDPCCESQFNFEGGLPIAGPATIPLRRYRTFLDGHFLTITDEPL